MDMPLKSFYTNTSSLEWQKLFLLTKEQMQHDLFAPEQAQMGNVVLFNKIQL